MFPLPFVKEYYAQRGSAPGALLISEATFISPRASGYPSVPGICNGEQIAAWKEVTKAVHDKGSYIFLQRWAMGRTANPEILKSLGDYQVVSSSLTPETETSPVPHELSVDEIRAFAADYAQVAKNAIEAGFDGFTQDTCNKRTDAYGGGIENRSRFGLEVARVVVDAVGGDRTGIRLSPFSTFQGMRMRDPIPQFSHLLHGAQGTRSGLHPRCGVQNRGAMPTSRAPRTSTLHWDIWGKASPVLLAGGFTPALAKRAVDEEYKDKDVAIV